MQRVQIAGLVFYQGIAFGAFALAYLIAGRNLNHEEFGIYAIALAIGQLVQAVMDGGAKLSLITTQEVPTRVDEQVVTTILLVVGAILSAVVFLVCFAMPSPTTLAVGGTVLVVGLSYPWLCVPTARLERALRFGDVSRAEAFGMACERLMPFALLWLSLPVAIVLVIGRVLRLVLLIPCAGHSGATRQVNLTRAKKLFSYGFAMQISSVASQLRDNIHVLLVPLLYDVRLSGLYGWCLQLCLLSTQAMSQIAARISVPMLVPGNDPQARWAACLVQIRWLAIAILPIIAVLSVSGAWINEHFFAGAWTSALVLLPWFLGRMIPGIATTALGALVLVQSGPHRLARVNVMWMVMEWVVAGLLLCWSGSGYAWSAALMVWPGLLLLVHASFTRDLGLHVKEVLMAVFIRPALGVGILGALIIAAMLHAGQNDVISCVLAMLTIIVCALLSEHLVRDFIRTRIFHA